MMSRALGYLGALTVTHVRIPPQGNSSLHCTRIESGTVKGL